MAALLGKHVAIITLLTPAGTIRQVSDPGTKEQAMRIMQRIADEGGRTDAARVASVAVALIENTETFIGPGIPSGRLERAVSSPMRPIRRRGGNTYDL